MTFTVAEARTRVSSYLDDDNNDRWSTSEIDDALSAAVVSVVSDASHMGLPNFTQEVNASSSASTGELDLSSYSPLWIQGVQIKVASTFYRVPAIEPDDRDRADTTSRDCYVQLVPSPTISGTTSHPLIQYAGDGTGMGSDAEFDHLACVRAAIDLSSQDAEPREDLRRIEADLMARLERRPTIPQARLFPRKARWYSVWLRWYWSPRDQKLYLTRLFRY